MYYKLKVLKEGFEIVDYVEAKTLNDGFIYATSDEVNMLDASLIKRVKASLDTQNLKKDIRKISAKV